MRNAKRSTRVPSTTYRSNFTSNTKREQLLTGLFFCSQKLCVILVKYIMRLQAQSGRKSVWFFIFGFLLVFTLIAIFICTKLVDQYRARYILPTSGKQEDLYVAEIDRLCISDDQCAVIEAHDAYCMTWSVNKEAQPFYLKKFNNLTRPPTPPTDYLTIGCEVYPHPRCSNFHCVD